MIAALVALPLLSAASIAPPSDTLDPETLARGWFEERELDPTAFTVPDVFEERFAHLQLGSFDLCFPPGSFRNWSQEYIDCIGHLLELQEVWLGWFAPRDDAEGHARALADLATLREWADSLSKSKLKKLDPGPGADLLELLEADEATRTAAFDLATYFGTGGPLSLDRKPEFVQLVFAPSRTDFVATVAVIGLLDKDWRHEYWAPDIVNWTHCEWGGIRVLALEFATLDADRDYTKSISMTQKNKRALVEHVVQLGGRTLFEKLHVSSLFAVALGNNLTIEIFGEVDTRNDGDPKARKIEDQDIFVPGALTDGILPAANADSRWRRDKGKDYFVHALRKGQKDGGKKIRSKQAKKTGFQLEGDQGGKHVVIAPFFGPGSEPPPPDFLSDYVEFLRAYRAGFLYWLREHGVEEDPRASHRAFGQFLALIARGEADMGQALEKVYPLPLSATPITEETLEGRFLNWLAKGK